MAVLTITYQPAVGARVIAAFGKIRGLKDGVGNPRSATVQEIEDEVRQYLIHATLEQEQRDAAAVAAAGVQPVILT